MAKSNNKKPKNFKDAAVIWSVVAVIALAGLFYFTGLDPTGIFDKQAISQIEALGADPKAELESNAKPTPTKAQNQKPESTPKPTKQKAESLGSVSTKLLPEEGKLTVTIIDVGQGDSIFIQSPSGKTMLIDSSIADAYDNVTAYLDAAGVKKIDILIATHPHSDHIGCMAKIVKNYDIGAVYMPKVTHTTKTFERLLTEIRNKGLKIKMLKAGDKVDFDDALSVLTLAPVSEKYDDMNDYSIVTHITYGKTKFLLTGDMEAVSEAEVMKKFKPSELEADVLKIAHHGSSSSTTEKFLKAVKPKYAAISLGEGNTYNHPHKETMQRLEGNKINTLRTDLSGTITYFSDGTDIKVETEK